MTKAQYFPCLPKYKTPVGGVKINQPFKLFLASAIGEKAFFVLKKEGEGNDTVYYQMEKTAEGYTIEMAVTSVGLYFYHFEIEVGNKRTGVFAGADLTAQSVGDEWQLTAFEENYTAPSLFKGGIIYQIMVDRFKIGKKRIKSKSHMLYREDWGGTPYFESDEEGNIPNNDMFGGNLYGVIEKLPYLKSLGVKCIYLNPLFEAQSNHKYDTSSYRRVDSDFGGEEALDLLIKKAKKLGVGVMLDGVFSHTGSDSVYFNKENRYDSEGAYQSKDSPYYEWYDFENYPDKYDCWWGVKILPCVKEDNPSYNEFINGEDGIVRHYIRRGVAGWRLDVADELPDKFLDNLTKAVKSENKDAVVLGEVWEDASNKEAYGKRRRYFLGKQLDSVTNYPFKNAIIDFALDGKAEELKRVVYSIVNNYPKRVLDNLMNTLSTHDTVRALTLLSSDKLPEKKSEQATFSISDRETALLRVKIATVLQFCLPGVPSVYYGDEAGMEGGEDPFNRRCYPWGEEEKSLVSLYKTLGRLRKRKALNGGDIVILKADDGVFDFVRGGKLRVIVNASDKVYELDKKVVNLLDKTKTDVLKPLSAVIFTV